MVSRRSSKRPGIGLDGKSELEEALAGQLRQLGLPKPEREYPFCAKLVGEGDGIRKRLKEAGLQNWLFDFAWPDFRFAVEVEGGIGLPGGGRHQRADGFRKDTRKYHFALKLGWVVYRCESKLINSWEASQLIEDIIKYRRGGIHERISSGGGRVGINSR